MTRRTARAVVMKLLYSLSLGCEDMTATMDMLFEEENPPKDIMKYITKTLDGVREHIIEIDDVIDRLAQGWAVERLPKVDLAILRMGVYELIHTTISDKVTINECVELAKTYASPASKGFVNGVLASCKRELDSKTPDGIAAASPDEAENTGLPQPTQTETLPDKPE